LTQVQSTPKKSWSSLYSAGSSSCSSRSFNASWLTMPNDGRSGWEMFTNQANRRDNFSPANSFNPEHIACNIVRSVYKAAEKCGPCEKSPSIDCPPSHEEIEENSVNACMVNAYPFALNPPLNLVGPIFFFPLSNTWRGSRCGSVQLTIDAPRTSSEGPIKPGQLLLNRLMMRTLLFTFRCQASPPTAWPHSSSRYLY
jgi:hypothetical protein